MSKPRLPVFGEKPKPAPGRGDGRAYTPAQRETCIKVLQVELNRLTRKRDRYLREIAKIDEKLATLGDN